MDRSNPYYVARKPQGASSPGHVQLQSSLRLMRVVAEGHENASSGAHTFEYPEPPTEDGNGAYWTAPGHLTMTLAPREQPVASPAPFARSSSHLSEYSDAAAGTDQITYSPASRKRPAPRDARWSPRASAPVYAPVALTRDPRELDMRTGQQQDQLGGSIFSRSAGLYPPVLPPLPHSISSVPISSTPGHRVGTVPTPEVQTLVNTVYAIARMDGGPPYRKHLLDPTEINPAVFTI